MKPYIINKLNISYSNLTNIQLYINDGDTNIFVIYWRIKNKEGYK